MPSLCLLFALLLPSIVAAQGIWSSLHIGYNAYSMSDVNDVIAELNEVVGVDFLDEINGGVGVGVNVGYQLRTGFGLGVGYERLHGGTEYSEPGGKLQINVPANVFKLLVEYHFPAQTSAWMYLSGEVGVLSTAGDAVLLGAGETLTADYEGSSLFAAGLVGVGIPLGNGVEIHGQGGYRYSKIGEVKDAGVTLFTSSGSKMTHDYSGILLRAGLRVRFGSLGKSAGQ